MLYSILIYVPEDLVDAMSEAEVDEHIAVGAGQSVGRPVNGIVPIAVARLSVPGN